MLYCWETAKTWNGWWMVVLCTRQRDRRWGVGGSYVHTCSWQPVLQNIYPLQWLISLKAIHWLPDGYTCCSPTLGYHSGWCVSLPAVHCTYEIVLQREESCMRQKWHLFTAIPGLSFRRFSSQFPRKLTHTITMNMIFLRHRWLTSGLHKAINQSFNP